MAKAPRKDEAAAARERERNRRLADVFRRRAEERERLGHVVAKAQAAEEAALAAHRAEIRENYRDALAEMAGFDGERPVLEQCWKNEFTEAPKKEPRRRVRRSIVHDPRVRLDDHLREAGKRFDHLLGESERLGSMRGCLAVDILGRPSSDDRPEADPDAKRARIVGALRAMRGLEAKIPRAATKRIGDRWLSQADALRVCLIEGRPLTALAGSRSGSARAAAHELLCEMLETLAKLIGEKPRHEPTRSCRA